MAVAERAVTVPASQRTSDTDIRMIMTASPELWAQIERLAADTRSTPSEVFTRALTLYRAAVDAAWQGKKVGFAATADVLDREVVGLVPDR